MENPAFELNAIVQIREYSITGFVKAFYFDRSGWQYRVHYADKNGLINDRYFYGDELIPQ